MTDKLNTKVFRTDINGLKSIAIIAVVLYHAFTLLNEGYYTNFHLFDSGFLGVDIFLVISGFLIVQSIQKQVDTNTFTLLEFFKKRFFRILPPLLVVIAFVMAIGYFILLPRAYLELAREVKHTLCFIVNYKFASSGGYFSLNSADKVLLHCWYLALLIQFYIVIPFVYALCKKLNALNRINHVIYALFFVTLVVSAIFQFKNSSYLLTHTRIFELFFGSAVFYASKDFVTLKNSQHKNIFCYLALLTLILAFFSVSLGSEGWRITTSLVTVISTGAILFFSLDSKILSNKVLNAIGKASYSLYLWHWPLLIFILKCSFSLDILHIFIICGLLSVFTYLSFKFVEPSKLSPAITGGVFLALLVGSIYIKNHDGDNYLSAYLNNSVKIMDKGTDALPDDYTPSIAFSIDGENIEQFGYQKATPHILLVGDSHLEHYIYYVKNINKEPVYAFYKRGTIGYGPIFSNLNVTIMIGPEQRKSFYNTYKKLLARMVDGDKVVIASRWDGYDEFYRAEYTLKQTEENFIKFADAIISDLEESIQQYQKLKFYIVNQGITLSDAQVDCLHLNLKDSFMEKILNSKGCNLTVDYRQEKREILNKKLKELESKFSNVTVIDRNKSLEVEKDSYMIRNQNGEPLFFDDNHLSAVGSVIVGEDIMKQVLEK